jgi:hypothetical protein
MIASLVHSVVPECRLICLEKLLKQGCQLRPWSSSGEAAILQQVACDACDDGLRNDFCRSASRFSPGFLLLSVALSPLLPQLFA